MSSTEGSKETLLAELTAEHRRLDDLLRQLERRRALTPTDRDEISRLKKQKLLFKDRIAPVKALLLDQRVVAGLGNIYVCEALYLARIAPTRAAGTITRARLTKLVVAVRDVLEAAIRAGGSTLKDYARPDGELGYFAKEWRVYGREGEACECGGLVERRVDSGRSTFWCPLCQK